MDKKWEQLRKQVDEMREIQNRQGEDLVYLLGALAKVFNWFQNHRASIEILPDDVRKDLFAAMSCIHEALERSARG